MNLSKVFTTIFVNVEDLQKISKMVEELFTSTNYTTLAANVTDYWIDQVMMKVNALSDLIFCEEKTELRKLVITAKKLSQQQNLLVGGDFSLLNNWFLGKNTEIKTDSDFFKNSYLFLPPPTRLYPSYAFQKISTSKLKNNTRYTISGFIAQSKSLELVISRFDKEVSVILNVQYTEPYLLTADNQATCCKMVPCPCPNTDSQFFAYSIDIGTIFDEFDPGIELGLRIIDSNGFAIVGNLEVREERALTPQEIQKIKAKERIWINTLEKKDKENTAILQPIIDHINTLYKDENWKSTIHPHITYQDIYAMDLPELSELRNWFMADRQGPLYKANQELHKAIKDAFIQLEEQNLIHNGYFINGTQNWLINGPVEEIILTKKSLELSDWTASIAQSIEITNFNENGMYLLRIHAKGKGTVTIKNNEETLICLPFNYSEFDFLNKLIYLEDPSFIIHIQADENNLIINSVEFIEELD